MIVAAYAGTGKTTFAAMHPQKAIDFVCMPFKYYLDPNTDVGDGESAKANPDHVMQSNWPHNYVTAIKESMSDDRILLIPSDVQVLRLLENEGISYTLCYP